MEKKQWILVTIEEAQLYMKNIRGSVAQNILRVASAGRNQCVRCLAISPDLALLDASFIRLTGQRYYARINREENIRRKFRNYHGGDWLRVCEELDLGYFIYMLRDQLKIVQIPLFTATKRPEPYQPKPIITPQPRGLIQKIRGLFK